MLDWLTDLLSTDSDTMWTVSVTDEGYIVDAHIHPLEYEKKHDHTHEIELTLAEPARDNNTVTHFNIRSDGRVVSSIDLVPGDETTGILLTPEPGEIGLVAVTDDDRVYDTTTLEITEMPAK